MIPLRLGMKKMSARKYKNIPTVVDGIRFHSAKEAHRYCELKVLEGSGQISDLKLQPKFVFEVDGRPVLIRSAGYPNGRQASYKADFAYKDTSTRKTIVEDVKGGTATRTEAYALRRAIVEAIYPDIRIIEV